jgi:hypothetical protein
LQDTHSIVATLEAGIGFLFHFVFAAIYLLVWGMDIVKGFSTFSATVLALTFVFGNSVRCAAALADEPQDSLSDAEDSEIVESLHIVLGSTHIMLLAAGGCQRGLKACLLASLIKA